MILKKGDEKMPKREGMYFYRDWIGPFEKLSDAERGRFVLAMMKYAMEGKPIPSFKGYADLAAMFVFPQIDRSILCRENGKKGGEERVSREKAKEIEKKKEAKELHEKNQDGSGEKRFEEFWREYPKKTGKAEARKAFFAVDPDDTLLRKMTDAIKEQKDGKQWKSEGGRYIPSPALWLSREQWEDEPCEMTEERTRENSSFDTDDFFEAALRRSYGDDFYENVLTET